MPLIGESIGAAFIKIYADGTGLTDSIRDEFEGSDDVFDDIGEDNSKAWNRGFRNQMKRDNTVRKSLKDKIDKAFGEIEADSELLAGDFSNDVNRHISRGLHRIAPDLEHDAGEIGTRMSAAITREFAETGRLNLDIRRRLRDTIREMDTEVDRSRMRIHRFSDAVGRAFGKGARNDFINIIGVMVGGLTKLAVQLPGVSRLLGESSNGLQRFAVGLAVTLPVIAVAIGLVSGLAGGLTALASSLGFALVGALGAVAGALVPLAAGIGVTAIAILGMSDATKELVKNALVPLKNAWDQISDAVAEEVFSQIDRQVELLTPTVLELGAALTEVGSVVADLGTRFAESTRGPGWQSFIGELGTSIPEMLRDLGNFFIDFTSGLVGMFKPAATFLLQFTRYLEDLGDRFNRFVNSARGEEALTKFFEHAATSLKVVWDTLGDIGGLLGTIFSAGRVSGDNLFTAFGDSLDALNEKLKANPEILRQWFEDSEKVTKAVGNLFVAFGRLFQAFDSPGARQAAADVLDALANSISNLSAVATPLLNVMGDVMGMFAALPKPVQEAAVAFLVFGKFLPTLTLLITGLSVKIRMLVAEMVLLGTLGGGLRGVFASIQRNARVLAGGAGLAALTISSNNTHGALSDLLNVAGAAAIGFSVAGPWGAAIAGGAAALMQVNDAAKKSSKSIDELADSMDSLGKGSGGDAFLQMNANVEKFRGNLDDTVDGLDKWSHFVDNFAMSLQSLDGKTPIDEMREALGASESELTAIMVAVDKVKVALDPSAAQFSENGFRIVNQDAKDVAVTLDQLQPAMDALGISLADLAGEKAPEFTDQIIKWIQHSESAQGRMESLKGAVDDLDNGLINATDSAKSFADAMDQLINPSLNAEEAVDKLQGSLKELSGELVASAGFDKWSKASLKNRELTREIADELQNVLEKQIENGKGNEKLARTVEHTRQRFFEEARDAGFSADEIERRWKQIALTPKEARTIFGVPGLEASKAKIKGYIEQLKGKVPKSVITKIQTGDLPTSRRELRKWVKELNLTPKEKHVLFNVVTKKAREDVDKFKNKVDEVDQKQAEPEVKVDTDAANKKVDTLQDKIDKYGRSVRTATLKIDDSQAVTAMDHLFAQGNRWDQSVFTATFSANRTGGGGGGPGTAAGGIFSSAQTRLIGEAGTEAVVPLRRPLGQVDPSVRFLSAFAQGIPLVSPNGGKTLNVGPITINTPTTDPRAVATETVNRLALVGGF